MYVKGKQRTREEWQVLMDSFRDSGLSEASFCRREKLSPSRFVAWRRKLPHSELERENRMLRTHNRELGERVSRLTQELERENQMLRTRNHDLGKMLLPLVTRQALRGTEKIVSPREPKRSIVRAPLTRFLDKREISETHFYDEEPCWHWHGSPSLTDEGVTTSARRWAYGHFIAPIGKKHLVKSCNTVDCVNPAHLKLRKEEKRPNLDKLVVKKDTVTAALGHIDMPVLIGEVMTRLIFLLATHFQETGEKSKVSP